MRSTLRLLGTLVFSSGLALAQLPTVEPPRGWKMVEGQTFQASLAGFDGTTVIFRMANGARTQAPAAKLSAEDQTYLAEWVKKLPIVFKLPDTVGVDMATMKTEVVSEDEKTDRYIYRTTRFEFESQGKFTTSLLREIGRDFEATYELVRALPWGIEPAPEEGTYFRAKLLKNRTAYFNEGGPPNSGGVYSRQKAMFMVPFESMGLKPVGRSYAKDADFDTSTIVHELTHQMMHGWLNQLPQWVVEGTAEYTGNLPLKAGKFRVSAAKSALKNYLDFLKIRTVDGMPEPYPLESLLTITNEQWSDTLGSDPRASRRMYFTSYLLVYYFMHLDGKGDSQRFVRYFREIGGIGTDIANYRQAVAAFKKQPGVTVNADGSYSYPGSMTPPERPAALNNPEARTELQRKALQILLDGRTEAALMKDIRSAYTKLGIRL